MAETISGTNDLQPAGQDGAQELKTTTQDDQPALIKEPSTTTTVDLESRQVAVSDSGPVITESEEHIASKKGLSDITLVSHPVEPEMSNADTSSAQPQAAEASPRPEETIIPVANLTEPKSAPAEDVKPAADTPSKTPADDASPELQNKLTGKFKDAEWKALNEFRAQLPDAFSEAYPDQPKARETPITLWGVTLDPTNPKNDARVSVILMKFLRARHLAVGEARAMLVNTLRWREEFNVKGAIEEDYPQEIFGNVGHIFGRDKEQRPVVYNMYGGKQDLKAVFGDVNRFLRWRVALMEKSVSQLDFNEVDQTVQIHDYAGVSISSRDANARAAASEASNIFQSHYPEFLHQKFFVNVPTLLAWIFWAFKPLVSSETFAKMHVAGSGKSSVRKTLASIIDIDQLPVRYGGEAEAF